MKQISKVNILAAQIRATTPTKRSQSMKQAWAIIKATPDASILTFTKIKTGEQVTRVVSSNWGAFYTPKGNGTATKSDQVLFADLCKVAAGIPPIISTYQSNIVALAA